MIFPSNSESFVEGLKSTTLLFKTMFLFLALKTTVVDSTRFWGYPFESILLSYLKHAICHPKWQVYDTESKEFLNQKSYVFSVFLTKKKSPSDVSSVEMFFFWKKLKDVFFSFCTHWAFENFMTWHPRISREIQLKISKIQNLWQTSLNAKCIRVRTGLLFFLVNRWWGAPGKCPTSAFRRNIARLSSGLSDLERLSQNSLPRSGFCLSFCCKCWGDYVYIYIYIYFLYIYMYIIFIRIHIYIYMCSYMHMIFI